MYVHITKSLMVDLFRQNAKSRNWRKDNPLVSIFAIRELITEYEELQRNMHKKKKGISAQL